MPAPRLTTDEYFQLPETVLPQELTYGIVRDAAAPTPGHQWVVGEIFVLLRDHVERLGLGHVWVSPIDVVLDRERHLIVQPDVIFISTPRLYIVTDRVWGAPDLVVEVLSPQPRIGRLDERVRWFAEYGVQECWLVHQVARTVEVLRFAEGKLFVRTLFGGREGIRSALLPSFDWNPASILREGV